MKDDGRVSSVRKEPAYAGHGVPDTELLELDRGWEAKPFLF